MDADRIDTVADGRVAEAGDHDELVAADGAYASLYAAMSGLDVEDDGAVAAHSD